MLTRQGWLVAAGAVVLVAGGRIFGLVELFVLGGVAVFLLVVSSAHVMRTRLDLEVGRVVHPPRVHAGSPSRVDLTVKNLRAARTPVLRLHDPVSGTRGADLLLAPLGRRAVTTAAYRLPTERRGIVGVGPLAVIVTDPFGLAQTSVAGAPQTELTVFPRIDDIEPVPYTSGHDPLSGAKQPNALGRTGEDFYALRPYVVGDDLRRVHWPSTARHDELLVRQTELPWQGRTTVLLDVRRSAHRGESLELAVSAAASVVTANWRRRDLVRLLTTDGSDSGFGPGHQHVEAIMEHLAVVQSTTGASLRGMLDHLGRSSAGGGALVVVVAEVPDEEIEAIGRLDARYGSVTTVVIERSAWDRAAPSSAARRTRVSGTRAVLRVGRDVPFVDGWNRMLRLRATMRSRAVAGASR